MLINKIKSKIQYFTKKANDINQLLEKSDQKIDEIISNQNLQNQYYINLENSNQKILEQINAEISKLRSENETIISKLTDLKKFQYCNPEYDLIDDTNKKILICGFFGADNLGDELMLNTLLAHIPDNNKYEIWIMLANNNNYDIYKNGYYHYIHYPQTKFDIQLLAKKFEKVVFAGGAHIDPDSYDKNYINELSFSSILIDLSISMINEKKEVYLIGLSTNKYIKDNKYINKLQYIIDNCKYISLRDTNSIDSLENASIQTKRIQLQDDIVLSNIEFLKSNSNVKKNTIGVILICNEELKEKNLIILEKLKKLKNYNITLIPFYDYMNNDYVYYKDLIEIVKENKNIKLIEYSDNIEKVNQVVSSMEYIISARYHGILISMILGKKLLALYYDKHSHYHNKVNYLYEKYVTEKYLIKYSEINSMNINKIIEDFISNSKETKFDKTIIKSSTKELDKIVEKIIK